MTMKVAFLCCLFVYTECRGIQPADPGVLQIKSNSPAAPFVAAAKSATFRHRTKRGASGCRLTYEERVDFLNSHNEYRRNVQPPAADMQSMVWHDVLADMAQEWADRCIWKHGNPERDPEPFGWIGQNMFATTAATTTGSQATTSWYNEVADYTFATNTCASNKVCGHYTQVVWAKSNYLGCASARCPDLVGANLGRAAWLVVCNYGPGGNYNGQKPYTEGTVCQSCPSGTTCDNSLCVPNPKCGEKTCENGGTLNTDSCECQCEEPYSGATCSTGNGDGGDGGSGEGDNGDGGSGEGDNGGGGSGEGDNGNGGSGEGDNGDGGSGEGDNGDGGSGEGDNGDGGSGEGDNGNDGSGEGDNGDGGSGDSDNEGDDCENDTDDNGCRTAGQSHVATPALFLPMATCALTAFTFF